MRITGCYHVEGNFLLYLESSTGKVRSLDIFPSTERVILRDPMGRKAAMTLHEYERDHCELVDGLAKPQESLFDVELS